MTEWLPTVSAVVMQVADLELPLPPRARLLQPGMATPPSRNCTLPPGAEPVTVAVNPTDAPGAAGLGELETAMDVDATEPDGAICTSSTNAVKSLPAPTPTISSVWLPAAT